MRPFVFQLLVVVFVSQLVACAVNVDEQSLSRPQLSENRGFSRDGRIEQDGVEIFVRPTNRILIGYGVGYGVGIISDTIVPVDDGYRSDAYYPQAPRLSDPVSKFYIEFFIKTKQALNIHVDQVILTLPNGEIAKPIAYLGPMEMLSTANYSLDLCYAKSLKEIHSTVPIFVQDSICFAAIYSVIPPLPADRFSLKINGINIGHEPLELPGIEFEQSQENNYHP